MPEVLLMLVDRVIRIRRILKYNPRLTEVGVVTTRLLVFS